MSKYDRMQARGTMSLQRDLEDDEWEFVQIVDQEKKKLRTPFLPTTVYLRLAKQLGYVKVASTPGSSDSHAEGAGVLKSHSGQRVAATATDAAPPASEQPC
jgi:hypothetical protein